MSAEPYLAHASAGDDNRRWYVVQAQPRREKLALEHLTRQHFISFCPVQRRVRKIGRHIVTALEPFFPGYVFVKVDLKAQPWRSINGTTGVIRLVGFGARGRESPRPLPPGLVEQFQQMSDNEAGELRFEEWPCPGDSVRIMRGPFRQLVGTLESAGEMERVTILLQILSTETRVRLRRDMLVAA